MKQEEKQGEQLPPRKLNWTKVLFDYHICIDAESFAKWDNDLEMDNREILEKDIPRTRADSPEMQKESFRSTLRRIATFYCKQNGVSYQQGLLEVIYPFALLRRKDFPTKKCYAYFNSFMRKHFPKVLVQRVIKDKKQLPHAILALTLTECLLKYHYPSIANGFKQQQIPMSMIATQQLLTVFAKNLQMEFVYEIFDYYIQKNDPNHIFYMEVGLIGVQEEKIMQALSCQQIHQCIRNLKNITSMQQLQEWLKLTDEIAMSTPASFAKIANEFGFTHRNILTVEDLQKMLNSQQILAGGYLPVSIEQINKNIENYVFLLVENELATDLHKYSYISISQTKTPNLSKYIESNKIFVLAAHESNLMEETNILIALAKRIPTARFVMLREHLVNQKNSKCQIF